MPAAELAADRDLQQRLLGVTAGGDEENDEGPAAEEAAPAEAERASSRCGAHDDGACRRRPTAPPAARPSAPVRGFTRWNAADPPSGRATGSSRRGPSQRPRRRRSRPPRRRRADGREARVVEFPVAATVGARRVHRRHVRHQGPRTGLPAQLPGEARPAHGHRGPRDLGQAVAGDGAIRARWRATIRRASARCSPAIAARAVTEMAMAFEHFIVRRRDLGGLDLGRRLGRHGARDAGDARVCRSACPR